MKRAWVALMLATTTYAATAQAQEAPAESGGGRFSGRVLDEVRAERSEQREERRAERQERRAERQAGSEPRAERADAPVRPERNVQREERRAERQERRAERQAGLEPRIERADAPARDRPRREGADRPRPVWGGDGGLLRPEWRNGPRDPGRAERREERAERRGERRDDRADRREDRREDRAGWRRDRRDGWGDGRRSGGWNFGWNGGFDQGRRDWDGRGWDRGWRNDNRYDWLTWRGSNRAQFRLPRYYPPRGIGYDYRRFGIGTALSFGLFDRNYWIDDPWSYRLPPAQGPYRWVRYYDDVLLIDLRSGRVLDAVHGFFW